MSVGAAKKSAGRSLVSHSMSLGMSMGKDSGTMVLRENRSMALS